MRTYRKVWINETLDKVSPHATDTCITPVAIRVPHTMNQIVQAYNFLGANYVPPNAFGSAVWKLYDGGGLVLQATFSGISLANDIFSIAPYAFHPKN